VSTPARAAIRPYRWATDDGTRCAVPSNVDEKTNASRSRAKSRAAARVTDRSPVLSEDLDGQRVERDVRALVDLGVLLLGLGAVLRDAAAHGQQPGPPG